LRSYTYDAAGNTKEYGPYTFTYNNRGRMKSTSGKSTNYLYNALGQMIEKSGTLGTTIFMQDEAGHLIGEYTSTGGLIEETIWLGDIPVATLRPNGSSVNIFYVHTDHLNSPRKVSRPSDNKLEWRWDADPFGTTAANQNPAGLGTFVYGLRFPGQYYMAETGLNQNWNRDYDPLIGKYIESDPLGLKAGLNTYGYVNARPTLLIDPLGLDGFLDCLLQQSTTHAPLNCNNVLMQEIADAFGHFACKSVKCTTTCTLLNFVGADVDEVVANAYKEMVLQVLDHIAETTASKWAKYGLPLVGEVDTLHDAIGTIRCVTNCVKN
jgi:RHS repeat-associated protein